MYVHAYGCVICHSLWNNKEDAAVQSGGFDGKSRNHADQSMVL